MPLDQQEIEKLRIVLRLRCKRLLKCDTADEMRLEIESMLRLLKRVEKIASFLNKR